MISLKYVVLPMTPAVDWAPKVFTSDTTSVVEALSSAYAWPFRMKWWNVVEINAYEM